MTTTRAELASDAGVGLPPIWTRLTKRTSFWMSIAVIVLIAGFGLLSPHHVFLRSGNFVSLSIDATEGLLLASGMTFLLGAGELDLSVGANLILSSVFGAKTLVAFSGTSAQIASGQYPHLALGLTLCIAVTLLTGLAFGAINALIVTVLRVNSFIATLATTGIGTGVALVATKGIDVPNIPPVLQTNFASGRIFGFLPYPVLLPLVIVPLLGWLMTRSRFGVHTQALGSSREAGIRAGIPARMHIFKLYLLMGALAAVAAIVDISRFGSTSVGAHTTDALAAIAACVIGGTSLFGGAAYIGGTTIGTFIPVILANGLVIVGVTAFWQLIVVGLILVAAVYVDQRRRAAR